MALNIPSLSFSPSSLGQEYSKSLPLFLSLSVSQWSVSHTAVTHGMVGAPVFLLETQHAGAERHEARGCGLQLPEPARRLVSSIDTVTEEGAQEHTAE